MKKVLFWIIAFLITASAAVYQRLTGPTYPLKGKVLLGDTEIKYGLARSHETNKDCELEIKAQAEEITGFVIYKRHKTKDPWNMVPMVRKEMSLTAKLPHQPPAGKLEYKVILAYQGKETSLSGDQPVVIRFKGVVPAAVLIPHIIVMFLAMLVSTRAGIAALDRKSNPRKYALWAAGLLFIGGMILGPIVQEYAFGELWTGFPFGYDLTDNKTLIAMLGWIAALIAGRKGKPARGWVLGASILLLVIYLIPHSVLGSELDYSKTNSAPSIL
ncbi:MAG: hypothetical protein JSV96_17810 [Candidatus Aminicenantes bacterium]|nr:MAG: hypothetical protein JSV96_17810 [Candidatus Aminicenantes bacterium]